MLDKLSLRLYLTVTYLLLPFVKIAITWRIKNGKEHPIRWREKIGKTSLSRPSGQLIWLHAVGLGEVLALRGLIVRLNKQKKNLNFQIFPEAQKKKPEFPNFFQAPQKKT